MKVELEGQVGVPYHGVVASTDEELAAWTRAITTVDSLVCSASLLNLDAYVRSDVSDFEAKDTYDGGMVQEEFPGE